MNSKQVYTEVTRCKYLQQNSRLKLQNQCITKYLSQKQLTYKLQKVKSTQQQLLPNSGLKNNKVAIVQLGCAKNIVDGEVFMSDLQRQGLTITEDPEEANKIIINTCAFIDEAKSESIEAILEARQLVGKEGQVVVTGCLSQRYSQTLQDELPEVDNFVGFEHYQELPQLLLEKNGNSIQTENQNLKSQQANRVKVGTVNVPFRDEQKRYRLTPPHMAYLRVAEGCNHKCTFCAIPSFRGKFRSKSFQQLLDEAKFLVEQGVKELCLIAEDTNQYGSDRKDGRNLAMLLREISKLEDLKWIRILYAYPSYFDDELIDEIAKNEKVCKYIDMPLQHINNIMLLSMNRPPRDHTEKLLNKLRDKIPNLTLRTTFISGFPGETEEHHQDLVKFVKQFKFQRLGVFKYSQEDDTPAGKMKDQVSDHIKQRRQDQLISIQQSIQKQYSQQQVDQELDIIIDQINDDGYLIGRTQYDAPEIDNLVYIQEPQSNNVKQALVGQIRKCKILNNIEFDLEAYPI